ncbi:MAG: trypsin-like peptidase domain-containing protein, partial [Nevskiaceae bacterium]|nr:trypsin-like peptidase domain-containing protein [Nevskiaceae bacterium]
MLHARRFAGSLWALALSLALFAPVPLLAQAPLQDLPPRMPQGPSDGGGEGGAPEGPPPAPVQLREDATWAATLERIAQSVVAIEIDQTRAFDTEWNTSSQATGFVVDAERGLVLTNRHVVTPGPVTAEATFLNREEVQLYPVYRDPVHDFGLYRYDPAKLRFIKPSSLPLYPEGAQIGREIRVIGNNAGEQLSILAGTIARLDRDAPGYGAGRYNDFNTFYLQAASGTSGGSSGSPVVDIEGRVVALNAGGATGAASSFYLPLGRVQRALKLIQAGKPVTRGTLQTVFRFIPFDELNRLGLDTDTEATIRKAFPGNTGMLVVSQVQPGSAAAGKLQPGDILVRVNGNPVIAFEPLEALLDDAIGQNVQLQVQRGGASRDVTLQVEDLHAITPGSFIEFGDAIVHDLSYQMARHFNLPVRGVFVANPGYALASAGVPRGALVSAVNGKPVANLADFRGVLEQLGDGERATLRYTTMDDPNGTQLKSMRMERHWFPARECQRNDTAGLWDCKDLVSTAAPKPLEGGSTPLPVAREQAVSRLAPSLVHLTFDMPFSLSGITDRNYRGTGLLVDAAQGLIITDRNTVPMSLGDVRITFGGALEIPGRVVFVHPLHNLAVVQYDPKLIGSTPMRAARLDPRPLRVGQPITAVGMDGNGDLKSRTTQVSTIEPLMLPLTRAMRFRDANIDAIRLVNPPDEFDGVLIAGDGSVRAMWSSFQVEAGREIVQTMVGVPIDIVVEMLDHIRSGQALHTLDIEMSLQGLASARRLGLPDAWLTMLQKKNPEERQVLSVTRITGGAPANGLLQQGDLVLAIDGAVVTTFRDVERATVDREKVLVTVWRDDQEQV